MISYVGGKFRQAKWINSFIPKNIDTYIEVFGGAMWVYIKGDINADKIIYNDYNPFMANLFACCKEYKEFIKYVDSVDPQNNELFEKFKEEIININNINIPNFDIGMKYVYMATQTFSGIVNEKVKMVDLKGKYKSKYLSFRDRLVNPKVQPKLDKLEVYNLSYDEIIPKMDGENTLIYGDPPYYGTEKLYGFHDFGLEDHEKLKDILKNCKSKWILSYYEFPDLVKWFPEDQYRWERKDYKKASMASKNKKQSTGTEVLVMNY